MEKKTKPQYWLIYSWEHHAWWGPASNGYTKLRSQAGKYLFDDAAEIVENANRFCGNVPNEGMTPVEE